MADQSQKEKHDAPSADFLERLKPENSFDDVGGLENLKDWLKARRNFFSDEAREFGLPAPRGVLILGGRGCGKSIVCKAAARAWELPLLRLDAAAVLGADTAEEDLRRALKAAETAAPCLLWIDEIEKNLALPVASDGGRMARLLSFFLSWLEDRKKPVFVAATANSVKDLPPEMLRKGRFDDVFFIDLPSLTERKQIFEIHLRKKKRDPAGFGCDILAQRTEAFSGAEIEDAVVQGLAQAFSEGREVTQADVESMVHNMVPLSQTVREDIQGLRSWAATRARPASRRDAQEDPFQV